MRYGLTREQRRFFECIVMFMAEHDGVGPSWKDLELMTGYTQRSIRGYLDQLRLRGWIDWIPNAANSIVILPDSSERFPHQYDPRQKIPLDNV